MASPYTGGPNDKHQSPGDTPGTALLFVGSIRPIRKGDGTYKLGAVGVGGGIADDPDLCSAVNALAYNDVERWPQEGGSATPLKTWLVDCPDANLVVNYMGLAAGFLPGVPEQLVASPPSWFTVASLDASGTVPYVNPSNSSNPNAIYALNYLLDDADYHL